MVAARESGVSPAELEARLTSLLALLPDLAPRLPSLKPEMLLSLAFSAETVAATLLELKAIFPGANAGRLLTKELGLMNEGAASLHSRRAALAAILPGADIDLIVQARRHGVLGIICTEFRMRSCKT